MAASTDRHTYTLPQCCHASVGVAQAQIIKTTKQCDACSEVFSQPL